MTVSDSNLASINALHEALRRLPNGVEAARLFSRLGLWTRSSHANPHERQTFPTQFSTLAPDQLSDLSARVISEVGVLIELVGLLTGIEAQLKVKSRSVRASARAKSRREWPEGQKPPAKHELDDLAEEDPAVVEVDEQLALLTLLKAQAEACRDANMLYREGVSREITYRSAQLQARMY